MRLSRRDLGFGAAALAVLGAATLGYRRVFGPPPTPYDDLLDQITDRRYAAALGRTLPARDAGVLAAKLRQPGYALEKRARSDAAAGRVVEAGGWIVPESVALYSALAAEFG